MDDENQPDETNPFNAENSEDFSLSTCSAGHRPLAVAAAAAPNVMIGTDMGHTDLYFFNMDTDQRIKVDLSKDPLWPVEGHCTPSSLRTAARPI